MHREVEVTVLYVTYDQSEALTMSDRIAVMHRGGIEQSARPEGLSERPATRSVASALIMAIAAFVLAATELLRRRTGRVRIPMT